MKALLCLSMLALCGCDQVVRTDYVGPSVIKHEVWTCTHFAYCFTCMPGFNMKMECGFKASSFCPGTQPVTEKYQTVRNLYKSGKVTETNEPIQTLDEGPCL